MHVHSSLIKTSLLGIVPVLAEQIFKDIDAKKNSGIEFEVRHPAGILTDTVRRPVDSVKLIEESLYALGHWFNHLVCVYHSQ